MADARITAEQVSAPCVLCRASSGPRCGNATEPAWPAGDDSCVFFVGQRLMELRLEKIDEECVELRKQVLPSSRASRATCCALTPLLRGDEQFVALGS